MLRYAMSKTIAVGKRFSQHSDSPESLPTSSSCGRTAHRSMRSDWARGGFALNAFDCSLLRGWCLPPARHWPGLVSSHCAPLQVQAAQREGAGAGPASLSTPEYPRVP